MNKSSIKKSRNSIREFNPAASKTAVVRKSSAGSGSWAGKVFSDRTASGAAFFKHLTMTLVMAVLLLAMLLPTGVLMPNKMLLPSGNFCGIAVAAAANVPGAAVQDVGAAGQGTGASTAQAGAEIETGAAVRTEFNGYLFSLKEEAVLSSWQEEQLEQLEAHFNKQLEQLKQAEPLKAQFNKQLNEQLNMQLNEESNEQSNDESNGQLTSAELKTWQSVTRIATSAAQDLYLADSLDTIEQLFTAGQLAYVEPNYKVELADVPNDTYYAAKQWYLPLINAEYAWDKGVYGHNVRIAVIDSGVIEAHEDLDEDLILAGQNYLADTNAADYEQQQTDTGDTTGHGTFICGLIGSVLNNNLGIAGLSSAVELVPLKCFAKNTTTYVSDLLQAIYDAVDVYDCDVLNMSWVIKNDVASLKTALEYAAAHGTILVAAAGNDGATSNSLRYPAAYDFVVGVGSLNSNLSKSGFSPSNSSIFVTAPGSSLYSLDNTSAAGYDSGSGTSYSTPLVAALAALLRSLDQDLTAADFMQLLAKTSTYLGDAAAASYDNTYGAAYNTDFGFGVINVAGALQSVLDQVAVTAAQTDNETVTLDVNGAIEKEASIIVAAFAQGGRLIDYKLLAAEDTAREVAATICFDDTAVKYVKTFVIDNNQIPLTEAGCEKIDL